MEKIKQFMESDKGKNFFIVLTIILVGLGSFGLGRLSKKYSSSGIKIEYPALQANTISSSTLTTNNTNTVKEGLKKPYTSSYIAPSIPKPTDTVVDKNFLASNRGSRYYPIKCSAGKNIKIENRIYFATESEAINKGYTKSTSCK